jgi:CO dehydrogenase nickel-insertion accessory protein CooC1
MEYFGGAVFQGGAVSCPVDDPSRLVSARVRWEDLPGKYCSRSPRGIRYLIAGKIADQGPGAGCDGPVAKIARDISVESKGETPGVMLIDFKAGFEDSARGVITGIDWGFMVIDPTTASVHMADDMKLMIEDVRSGVPPATEHLEDLESVDLMTDLFRNARIRGLSFLLNRVDCEETEAYLRQALAQFGIEPAAVIPADSRIARSWLRGEPIDGREVENELFHGLADHLGAVVAEQRTAV